MLDIKFVRDNPDAVKENIKKKFQDAKLPLVDEYWLFGSSEGEMDVNSNYHSARRGANCWL